MVDTGVTRCPTWPARLLPGHDFVNNNGDATDDNGHGTMAAGVIAAAGNDRKGVAGHLLDLPDPAGQGARRGRARRYHSIAEGIR